MLEYKRISGDFFVRPDVLRVAKDLLGKILVTTFDGVRSSGKITEVEAYRAPEDKASHAYGNRRTARTEIMFWEGGHAYIYLCYGIHHLFNVVTGPADAAHAVLIRGIEPLEGIEEMGRRRGLVLPDSSIKPRQYQKIHKLIGTGPGALSKSLGLTTVFTGQNMLATDAPFWLEDPGIEIPEAEIAAGPRIGVDYAAECAAWPWRFWIKNSIFVK
jgi:DNA-3-methyladenine glycosylase